MEFLLRVSRILAAAIAIHVGLTQPSSQKVVKEPASTTLGGGYLNRYASSGIHTTKKLSWALSIAEILFTLLLPQLGISTPPILHVKPYTLHTTSFSVIGFVLVLLGGSGRFVCYRTLQNFHSFRLSIVENHQLVTTGPYGIVRHPSYTAFLTLLAGMGFWYFAPGSILVEVVGGTYLGKALCAAGLAYLATVCWAVFGRITEEDELLKSTFGQGWEKWAQSVPHALVPGVY